MRLAFVILKKELREVLAQRALMVSLVITPVLFTLMPLLLMASVPELSGPNDDLVKAQIAIGQQFSLMLLMLPQLLPAVLAAQSVVGEKMRRTLEPLLATPISTTELLAGKIMGAVLPALIATWGAALIFAIGTVRIGVTPAVAAAILRPGWVLAILISSPLLSVIAVGLAVLISARVSDPRAAQQLSALLVLPLVGALAGQSMGLLGSSMTFGIGLDLVLAPLAVGVLALAVRVFEREAILTRWK